MNTNTSQFKLYSWNVLHIIHELNYALDCSFVLDKWLNNENGRLNQIAKIIVKYASQEKSVICLQECPGDLLQILNAMNRGEYIINNYQYGRTPKLKNHLATNPYVDITEHLVTIVGRNINVDDTQIVQFDDPGKASLIINVNVGTQNILIANIHCPFGSSRNVAFNKLLVEIGTNRFIIVGDLNSEQWELELMFDKTIYKFSNIKEPTRIAKSIKKTKKGNEIIVRETILDHLIGSTDVKFLKPFVEKNKFDLSDHFLIGCNISF
jgi:hypothetical protein